MFSSKTAVFLIFLTYFIRFLDILFILQAGLYLNRADFQGVLVNYVKRRCDNI